MLDQFNPANHPAIEIAAMEAAISVGQTFPDLVVLQYDENGLTIRSRTTALDALKAQL